MNIVYGALLLHSAGKEINEHNLKKVVDATGEKIDDSLVKALVAALDGVNIKEVIEKAAMPVAVAPSGAAAHVEAKVEEKSEEDLAKKAEEAAEGLGALFG